MAGLLFAVFIAIEARSAAPMLPLSFFRNPTFAAANVVGALLFFAMIGSVFFLTLYLQNVNGYTPEAAGIRLLPFSGMILLLAPIAGRTASLGSRGGRNTHLVRCCHAARPAGLSPAVEARVLAADCHRDAVRRRFKEVGSDKDNRHSLVRRSWRSASPRSCRAIRTLPFDLGAGGDRRLARTR